MNNEEMLKVLENISCEDVKDYSGNRTQALTQAISDLKEYEGLKTILGAWHNIFGTTQLTHAQARLEEAEKSAKKYEELKNRVNVERIDGGAIGLFIANIDNTFLHPSKRKELAQAIVKFLRGDK